MRSRANLPSASSNANFPDAAFLVLASLAGGPKHGYGMRYDIHQMCGARLGAPTLYATIGRLEQLGWIEALPPEKRRKPYRLTSHGYQAFEAKMRALGQIVEYGASRLALSEPSLAATSFADSIGAPSAL